VNPADLALSKAIGHTPLLDTTWTLLRDGQDVDTGAPWAEWECLAPSCRVISRVIVAPPDPGMMIETLWQEVVVWHPRKSPSEAPREPLLPLLAYAKELFVGTMREAVLVFPPRAEIPASSDEGRASLFALLGHEHARPRVALALPRFFTFLPPLP
jgi:hypothetical protein